MEPIKFLQELRKLPDVSSKIRYDSQRIVPRAAGCATLLDMFQAPDGGFVLDSIAADSPHKSYPINTEYIPSDIAAAPASGTIGSIVVLGVLAGCDQIDLVDGLPNLRGEHLSLNMREHPTLGLLAVCQTFITRRTYI
jgi:hypothetical protein